MKYCDGKNYELNHSRPLSKADGEIQIPGSKSLSNRILLLATLAKGTTKITNLLDSDDIRYMLESLKKLGVAYTLQDQGTTCILEGLGGYNKSRLRRPIFR
ncbi:hypothetical protein [Marinomonas sp. GJ51-6]|uniref:hypothetical protein n=1 Tax=Marinomonas sp. GJ51-6 TaxID=2992802 RepID=UPI0029349ECF|nr:hypothetical protein [Marinomonas sp. GJ51-6]WOD09345.1 hypothetical protein ONZ50_16040 [Marinomonas sp. GJ51-6]